MVLTRKALASLPFLNGVYVAIDALPGAFLVVDGPHCVVTKAFMQHGHNLRCTLLPPLGRPRIVNAVPGTGMQEVTSLSTDRTGAVEKLLEEVCAWPEVEGLFSASFDYNALLSFPLAELARRAARRARKPACHLAPAQRERGWLSGYARTCESLARRIDLAAGGPRPGRVAVVGYLFDRDEPDHAANLAELARLLAVAGLEPVSIWLSGKGLDHLRQAGRASWILSFPYARGAARALGRRLRRPVIEAELPIGLAGTSRFLMTLGRRLGREAAVRRFLDREAASAVRGTQDHVLRLLRGRQARVEVPDPHLCAGLLGLCADVGLDASLGGGDGAREGPGPVVFAPSHGVPAKAAYVPIGYPNFLDHPAVERPFLGFSGYRCLVDRAASALLAAEGRGDG